MILFKGFSKLPRWMQKMASSSHSVIHICLSNLLSMKDLLSVIFVKRVSNEMVPWKCINWPIQRNESYSRVMYAIRIILQRVIWLHIKGFIQVKNRISVISVKNHLQTKVPGLTIEDSIREKSRFRVKYVGIDLPRFTH